MLIKLENDTQVDYGIFAVCRPDMEVTAVRSSVVHTEFSGETPAIMVVQLERGGLLSTSGFVAYGDGDPFCEFGITDLQALAPLEPMLKARGGKTILEAVVTGDADGWVLGISFLPEGDSVEEEYLFLPIRDVFWTTEGRPVPRAEK